MILVLSPEHIGRIFAEDRLLIKDGRYSDIRKITLETAINTRLWTDS